MSVTHRPRSGVTAISLTVLAAGCADPGQPEAGGEALEPWAWEIPRCVAYQPEDYQAPQHRVHVVTEEEGVVTEVYEPEWGVRAVAEIRSVVGTCGSFEDGDLREQNMVVETGFAADESLLVETVRIAPPAPMQTSYAAVVRDGDAVMTVRVPGLSRKEALCIAATSVADQATCGTDQA